MSNAQWTVGFISLFTRNQPSSLTRNQPSVAAAGWNRSCRFSLAGGTLKKLENPFNRPWSLGDAGTVPRFDYLHPLATRWLPPQTARIRPCGFVQAPETLITETGQSPSQIKKENTFQTIPPCWIASWIFRFGRYPMFVIEIS